MNAPARRGPGNDPRIVTFRVALESLIESLDATVRITRWEQDGEPVPEPLRRSAMELQARLGSANRLARGRFLGAPAVIATSDAIRAAVQQLDAAFVAYHKRAEGGSGNGPNEAAIELEMEVGRVRLNAGDWG